MKRQFLPVSNLKVRGVTMALLTAYMLIALTNSYSQIKGSVNTGDGSTPNIVPGVCQTIQLIAHLPSGASNVGGYPWGQFTVLKPLGAGPNPVTYQFSAYGCGYYVWPHPPTGSATCVQDPKTGIITCSGSFDIKLYAMMGNFTGTVYLLPEGIPAGPGIPACTSGGCTYTDSNGNYNFAPNDQLHRVNNWGVGVIGDGSGPGSKTYLLTTDYPENGVFATTYSSTNITVELYKKSPYMEESSTRSCPAVGQPVSVATGNMFLDQIDIALPAIGPDLDYVRSYNSQLAYRNVVSSFGPGWSQPYEQCLSFPYY